MGRLSSRRGKLTMGIAGFTAVAVVALVLVLTAGPATAKQFATLHILAGTVEVDHGEGFAPGSELQTLREGDTVRTASDGRAEIEYFDGSATRLDYDTTFTIKRLESIPDEPGSKVIVGDQEEGQTFNRVVALTGSESRFETETPTATASVQGTAYVVKVHPDGSTEYWVVEGEITLTTPEGEVVTVQAGEGIVVDADGTVGEVFELTDEQLSDAFVDFNQCVLDGVEECVEGEVVTPEEEPLEIPSPGPTPTVSPTTEETQAPTETDTTDPGDGTGNGDGDGNPPPPDTTPPETVLTGGPSGLTKSSGATFTFTSNEPGSFACALDGGSFAGCSSPHTVGPLGDGTHTFQVRATDTAGNPDPTPASRSWTVDATPPETTITDGPGGDVVERGANRSAESSSQATFNFESSEPGSTFECSIDNGAFGSCSPPHITPALLDGSHDFAVRATDQAGNVDETPATRSWNIDTTAPETTITSGPSGTVASTTATFSFTSSEPGSAFECSLDSETFSACSTGVEYTGLSEAEHTFDVRAIDGDGNVDPSPASRTWTIDLGPPDTSITSGPEGIVESTSATFEFEASKPNSTFQCALDSGSFSLCTSPKTYSGPLSQGIHTFQVRAVDEQNRLDPSPATRSWRVGNPDAISVALSWSSGPNDLDLHVWTPNGQHVYFLNRHLGGQNCTANDRSGCWISLDRDHTSGAPGSETVTINPGATGFQPGTYTVYIDTWSCGQGSFPGSGTSVDIFGGGASSTFSVGSDRRRQWNVGDVAITSEGAAAVSSTDTYEGALCQPNATVVATRVQSAAREAAAMPAPTPDVSEFTTEDQDGTWLRAEVDGDTVEVEWAPDDEAEVRYTTEEFTDHIDQGELACRGEGECDFAVPEGAERLYLTVFPDGVDELEPVEGMNAVILDLEDSDHPSGDEGEGSEGPDEVPPVTPPEEEDPVDPPEETPDPEPDPEPQPEPTQDAPVDRVDGSAEGENATA